MNNAQDCRSQTHLYFLNINKIKKQIEIAFFFQTNYGTILSLCSIVNHVTTSKVLFLATFSVSPLHVHIFYVIIKGNPNIQPENYCPIIGDLLNIQQNRTEQFFGDIFYQTNLEKVPAKSQLNTNLL